jgi:uncharacterized protein DUF3990
MIIYHGSDVIVEKPRILHSNRMLDFGSGFYTTTNQKQATRWAAKVRARRKNNTCYISVYEFDMVIGPVADDNVYFPVKLYESGVLTRNEAIKRLKVERLFDQILFHTDKALSYCYFRKSIIVEENKNV